MTAQSPSDRRRSRPSKLKSAAPVGRDWPSVPKGAPRMYAPADAAACGIRWDDGAFSAALRRAFGDRDYGGRLT